MAVAINNTTDHDTICGVYYSRKDCGKLYKLVKTSLYQTMIHHFNNTRLQYSLSDPLTANRPLIKTYKSLSSHSMVTSEAINIFQKE